MIRIKFICKHIFIGAKNNFIGIRSDFSYKHRISKCNSKTFSLSDRVMGDSLVSSQNLTISRNKITRRRNLSIALPVNKSGIIC